MAQFWYLSAQSLEKAARAGCAIGKTGLWSVACTRSAFKLNKSACESAVRNRGGEK